MKTTSLPFRPGVVAALHSLGFVEVKELPPALRTTPAALSFTREEMEFAKYLVFDTDFGGAWDDDGQILSATTNEAEKDDGYCLAHFYREKKD